MTSFEKRKVQTAKLACFLLRAGGIRQLGITLPIVAMLLPNLPVNIFSYPPASYILNYAEHLCHHSAYWKYLEKMLVFVGNYLMWEIHVKLILVAAIEKIIGSVCLTLAILKFEREYKKSHENYLKACRFYRSIQLLTDMFNEVEAIQLVVILITFGQHRLLQVSKF